VREAAMEAVLMGLIALALGVYLLVALLRPERF
jgi:K+-transporting ATPase KdpF subunit